MKQKSEKGCTGPSSLERPKRRSFRVCTLEARLLFA